MPYVASNKSGGRPRLLINWEDVDKLLMAGCSGVQIAANIGVCPETLYERCLDENKKPFSSYSQEKKEKGNSLLHAVQYKVAMDKDKTMLIWLGKQRLNQREEPKRDESFGGELKEFIDYMKKKYKVADEEIVDKKEVE